MKFVDGWYWPPNEEHMPEWMADPRNRVILHGRAAYQGQKQLAMYALLSNARTAVDIGGHIGTWSFNLAHWFDTVIAFEPVPLHADCFVKNVPMENVTLHRVGLGSQPGWATAMPDPSNPEHSTGGTYLKNGGALPIRTLDEFNLHDVDLIKIDVEGRELDVCLGARETLLLCLPIVVIEQKDREAKNFGAEPKAALSYLKKLGMVELRPPLSGDYFLGWEE
jgi:FkbM family methyltransferase